MGKKDDYMRGYADGFKDALNKGETGMVPVTGKERPMLRPEAASTEARFKSASLHQSTIWPNRVMLTLKSPVWLLILAFSTPVIGGYFYG